MKIPKNLKKERKAAMSSRTHRTPARRRGRWAATGLTGFALCAVSVAVLAPATGVGAATPSFGSASGSVAALSASSMEVQGASSQTTVTWTGTTSFSKTVSETVSAIASSDCLTVTGTTSKKSKTTIAARSITITPVPSSGSCTALGTRRSSGTAPPGGFPGGGTGFKTGGPGGAGGGAGGGTRGGFPGAGGRGGSFLANLTTASGKVTSVSGSNVALTGIVLSGLGGRTSTSSKSSKTSKTSSKSSKSKKPPTPKTQKLKITTSKTTTLSETQAVTSSALALGVCVNALGPMASNGAVTASTVRITSPVGGSCTAGPGGFAGGGGGFFGGGGAGPTGSNG